MRKRIPSGQNTPHPPTPAPGRGRLIDSLRSIVDERIAN